MSVKYDENLIEAMAGGLYSQARSIEVSHALVGIACGLAVGGFGSLTAGAEDLMWIGSGIAGALGALLGIAIARPKAFALRVQAQTALCQVQIEKNTRKAAPQV